MNCAKAGGNAGNGTQEITSQLNSESWRDRHEKQGVRVFYGSIHDIGSFPCEVNLFVFCSKVC